MEVKTKKTDKKKKKRKTPKTSFETKKRRQSVIRLFFFIPLPFRELATEKNWGIGFVLLLRFLGFWQKLDSF